MFAILFLAVVAAAYANPMAKMIPVFEDVTSLRLPIDSWSSPRALCREDCHHHILHKPVFVVRSLPEAHSLNFVPEGLNGLGRSPLTSPLHEAILSPDPKVIAIFSFARFPWELFPGLLDSEVVIPEHATKLRSFYKEAPVVVVFTEEEFKKINEHRGLIQIADVAADSTGFHVARDFALMNRNAAIGVSPASEPIHTLSPSPIIGVSPAHEITPVRAIQPVQPVFPPPARTVVYPFSGGSPQYFSQTGESEAPKYYSFIPIRSA